ncbi:uncharacterized protein LOC128215874 [Mya arenaria]|uniref:uncharacterized protein LOC128215874 n=1 Tax=Mya arenaria TaxID=6604 RepID=UPI0022DF3E58|nr:uncharacterized protein LOC128215874 [Mya arenaria]
MSSDGEGPANRSGGLKNGGGGAGSLIEPDTFWDLIDNLLLYSTRDETRRRRHNVALSALCRGYALPQVHRAQQQIGPVKTIPATEPERSESGITNFKPFISKRATSHFRKTKKNKHKYTESEQCSLKDTTDEGKEQSTDEGKEQSTDEGKEQSIDKAKQTVDDTPKSQSECNVKDLDVVFVKNINIPASERLWRFAIRNRKKQENMAATIEEAEECANKPLKIPNARSNEAIFQGLQKRLKAAKRDENAANDKHAKKSKGSKKKHKHVKRHKCRKSADARSRRQQFEPKLSPLVKKVHSEPAASKKNTSNKIKITSVLQQKVDQSFNRNDHSKEQVSSLLVTREMDNGDSGFTINSTSDTASRLLPTEAYDAKKAQYDSVLRKRLNCGSQLDTLNHEIVNKRLNPRTTLNRETTRKYAELKTEYLRFCYQESALRQQIAIIQAEIYMMQNKRFHKKAISVKTMTLDPTTAFSRGIREETSETTPL